MSNHRDEGARRKLVRDEYLLNSTFTLTSFSEDWGPELAGSFALGTHKDIKLLEDFCIEHGFAFCESRVVYRGQVEKRLLEQFRVNPRGYLVVGYPPAAFRVRFLRLTLVTFLSSNSYRFVVSAPDGTFRELESRWFGVSAYRKLSSDKFFRRSV
jgi:hypothetical protein